MNYGSLASTGAGLTIGGIVFDQTWLIAVAGGLVILGALAIRFGFRRGKTPMDV